MPALVAANVTPDDNLTEHQVLILHILEYWMNGIVTNIVVVLGLIGNILAIVILSQREMRSSTNFYLTALAVWDSVVLICTVFIIGMPGFHLYIYNYHILPYLICSIYPIALIAQTATIWLTVSFTVERYIAVCHPLKAARMCTMTRAKIVIIGVSLGSTFYNIPRWFDYWPKTDVEPTTKEMIVIPARTNFSQNALYLQVYYSWLYVPIMCIVPILVLAILNTFLILAVRRSRRQRKDMNVKQSRENNVTVMLVSVVVVFIICQVPALVYNLAYAVDDIYVKNTFGYEVFSPIRNFLVNINSAVNFLLYCALGQKFRRIFINTCLRRCVRETYIPMSGVHHPTTFTSSQSQKRFYLAHAEKNNMTKVLRTDSTQNSTIPQGSGTSRSSQESSLYCSDAYNLPYGHQKYYNKDTAAGFVTIADKTNEIPPPQKTYSGAESDDDIQSCDVALEHLLPESDRDVGPVFKLEGRSDESNPIASTCGANSINVN